MGQKLGVYQLLQNEVSLCDISCEGEGRLDDVPIKVAPSDNCNDGGWWPGHETHQSLYPV